LDEGPLDAAFKGQNPREYPDLLGALLQLAGRAMRAEHTRATAAPDKSKLNSCVGVEFIPAPLREQRKTKQKCVDELRIY
jgi:hypothetical protein